MGKTNDAIAGLERARSIPERMAPEAPHVQTYLSLSRLYERKGDIKRVRDVLAARLERGCSPRSANSRAGAQAAHDLPPDREGPQGVPCVTSGT